MIKIMLDSSSDALNTHPYDYYIPLTVDIAGRCYKDGVDLKAQKFYKLLTSSKEFPKTSQPSPEDYIPYFEEAKQKGDEVIYLCVSSALSGTLQSAIIAKEIVEHDGIYIVDTKAVTHLIGALAREGHRYMAADLPAEDEQGKIHIRHSRQIPCNRCLIQRICQLLRCQNRPVVITIERLTHSFDIIPVGIGLKFRGAKVLIMIRIVH